MQSNMPNHAISSGMIHLENANANANTNTNTNTNYHSNVNAAIDSLANAFASTGLQEQKAPITSNITSTASIPALNRTSLAIHASHQSLYNRRSPSPSLCPFTLMVTPADGSAGSKQPSEINRLPSKCTYCNAYLQQLVTQSQSLDANSSMNRTLKCCVCSNTVQNVSELVSYNDSMIDYTSPTAIASKDSKSQYLLLVIDADLLSNLDFVASIQQFLYALPRTTNISLIFFNRDILSIYSFPASISAEFPHHISHSLPLTQNSWKQLDISTISNIPYSSLSSSLPLVSHLLSDLHRLHLKPNGTSDPMTQDSDMYIQNIACIIEWINTLVSTHNHTILTSRLHRNNQSSKLDSTRSASVHFSHVYLFANNNSLTSSTFKSFRSCKDQFIDLGERCRSQTIRLDIILNISTETPEQSAAIDILRYSTMATGGSIWPIHPENYLKLSTTTTQPSVSTVNDGRAHEECVPSAKPISSQFLLCCLLLQIFHTCLSPKASLTLHFSSSLQISRIIGSILSYDIKKRGNTNIVVVELSRLNVDDTIAFSFELTEELPGSYVGFQCNISYNHAENDINTIDWTRISTWRIPTTGLFTNYCANLSATVYGAFLLKDECTKLLRESQAYTLQQSYDRVSQDLKERARMLYLMLQSLSPNEYHDNSYNDLCKQVLKIIYNLLASSIFTGKHFSTNEIKCWRNFLISASLEHCVHVLQPSLLTVDLQNQRMHWPSSTLAWSSEHVIIYDCGLFIVLLFGEAFQQQSTHHIRQQVRKYVYETSVSRRPLAHIIESEYSCDWASNIWDLLEPMQNNSEDEQFADCSPWTIYTPEQRQFIIQRLRRVSRPTFRQFYRSIANH